MRAAIAGVCLVLFFALSACSPQFLSCWHITVITTHHKGIKIPPTSDVVEVCFGYTNSDGSIPAEWSSMASGDKGKLYLTPDGEGGGVGIFYSTEEHGPTGNFQVDMNLDGIFADSHGYSGTIEKTKWK